MPSKPLLPFPIEASLLISDILVVIPISLRLNRIWRHSSLLAQAALLLYMTTRTSGDKARDFAMSTGYTCQFFTSIHLLYLSEPFHDFHWVGVEASKKDADEDKGGKPAVDDSEKHPEKQGLWKRIWWTLCLIHSSRGVGWNYELPHLPPRPTSIRWTFIRARLIQYARNYLILDLAQYVQNHPSLGRCTAASLPLTSATFRPCFINMMMVPLLLRTQLTLAYIGIAIISVGCGFTPPAAWPAHFGKWSDAYTLRRLWGRTWHQLYRRGNASISTHICSLLNIKPKTKTSFHTQILLAFFLSGLVHTAGDWMIPISQIGTSLIFFMLQPLGMIIEAVFQALNPVPVKNANVKRVFGYIWVAGWFSILVPLCVRWVVEAGMAESEELPFSPVRLLVGFVEGVRKSKPEGF